jgi:hypothetical protein
MAAVELRQFEETGSNTLVFVAHRPGLAAS